ncbi:MAG: sensor histidine kinase [Candidatus Saccharimonadia bacterium]
MEQKRSYTILAISLAGLNALVLLVLAILYFLRPTSLTGVIPIEVLGGLSTLALLYFLSLHRILRKFHQGISTLVLTLLTTANLVLVIQQTGGLDSPFYSLWLLAIITSGIFGPIYTGIILALTIAVHIFGFSAHNFNSSYVQSHLIQLAISLLAAAVAQWVYYRGTVSHRRVEEDLSGQLGEEQLKAQALLTSMADGVIVVNQNRNVKLINRAAQEMTGWDESSSINIDYRIILKLKTAAEADVTDQNDPFLDSWNRSQSTVHNDLVGYTKSGKRIALSMSISPIYNPQHQITGGIALFRDISQEKEIERTRNEFVSTASHEMRTPVAAIEGYISLAMNPKVATIDDRARGYLDKAHENTQHLGALFRDLLSITKLDEGLIAKNLIPVNLTQMIKDITGDMQFAASKKNITVTMVQSGIGSKTIMPAFWVMVDSERMREVIMNLVENGMKFTHEGGITMGITGDDKYVTVSVHDSGIGIPKEDIGHLFQKFYRVDNSATRTIGGTGLGLFLCRTLIELFNGRIWVESEFGKGSTFFFSLPRIKEPASTPALNPTQAPNAAPAVAPAPIPIAQPVPVTPAPVPLKPIPITPAASVAPTPPAAQTAPTIMLQPIPITIPAAPPPPPVGAVATPNSGPSLDGVSATTPTVAP